MALSSSLEDYIEAIYAIIEANQAVRAKDISKRLGVSSSSVTGALRMLSDKNLINYEPYGVITLTKSGEEVAQRVYRKHETITEFFVKILGIESECAETNACKVEHVISESVSRKMRNMLDFVRSQSIGQNFIDEFETFNSGKHQFEMETDSLLTSEKE